MEENQEIQQDIQPEVKNQAPAQNVKLPKKPKDKFAALKKFVKIVRAILASIFLPVFALILIVGIISYFAKINNEVPSIFGISIVKVLSGSMEPDLSKGDVVVVNAVKNAKDLSVGDVIAFYAYKETTEDVELEDGYSDLDSLGIKDNDYNIISGAQNDKQRVAAKDASPVYIHKIDKIATPKSVNDPNYGKLFFHTTGNVSNSDEMWIMQDYVIGLWNGESNTFICKVLNFCASSIGNILLIIVPSMVIIAMLGISVSDEIKEYRKSKDDIKKDNATKEEIIKGIVNETEIKQPNVQTAQAEPQQNIVLPKQNIVLPKQVTPQASAVNSETQVKPNNAAPKQSINLPKQNIVLPKQNINLPKQNIVLPKAAPTQSNTTAPQNKIVLPHMNVPPKQ